MAIACVAGPILRIDAERPSSKAATDLAFTSVDSARLWTINGVAYALREGRNVIGREPAAHIRLDLAAVSRRHAAINIHGEEAVVQDLGSRNGTFVNGEKLEAARPLRSGDEIRIAQTAIRFQIAPGSARPTAPLGSRV